MTTRILFLCPHNAAKSVAAAALLARTAEGRGLEVAIDTAGTHPDDEVLPLVRRRLEADEFEVTSVPRRVSADDLIAAEIVVNIGCATADLPGASSIGDRIVDWSIPDFSDDPEAAFEALADHVQRLAADL